MVFPLLIVIELMQIPTICPHAIKWISFHQSTVGFGSTMVNLLGLAEYCERHEIDLHFNSREIVAVYLDGDADPWHTVFNSNCMLIRHGHERKYGVRLILPPSFPFFNYMTCCDDKTLFISNRWATCFHSMINRHLQFTDFMRQEFMRDRSILADRKVLGTHLRGTDHSAHGKTLTIEQRLDQVAQHLVQGGFDSLFVMTDERRYLDAALRRFGTMVCHLDGIERSSSAAPLHHGRTVANGTKILTDMVREGMVLANCHGQLLSRSGVSAFVRCLNPTAAFNLFEEDLTNHDLYKWKTQLIDQSIVDYIALEK